MNVIIYTRVSTDEQKEKGYSLQEQERRLRTHCETKGLTIVAHYQEDHPAGSFNRPEFNKLLSDLKEKRIKATQLICVKPDRFARNAEAAFNMTTLLSKLGIQVSFIENNYDRNDPNQLLMYAIVNTMPQVDNMIRADNTKRGMRQALREGRWVWKAPKGYMNDRINKMVVIGKDASFIRRAFEETARGLSSIDKIRKNLIDKGFKCSKQQFINLLKNPFYTGKIRVDAWKNEPEEIVKGIHEPIIDSELFEQVQNVLSGRCRKQAKKSKYNILFPLRGHLICNRCGNGLTASSSKGRTIKYDYYHCQNGCKERLSATSVNEGFVDYIEKMTISNNVKTLYNEIIKDVFREREGNKTDTLKKIDEQILLIKENLKKVDTKFINDEIDNVNYNRMTHDFKARVENLQEERATLNITETNLDRYFSFGLSMISNLDYYYKNAPIEVQHSITGSIFPEKLIFDGKNYRTARVNSLISLITEGARVLEGVKKKKATVSDGLSTVALPLGLEPRTL